MPENALIVALSSLLFAIPIFLLTIVILGTISQYLVHISPFIFQSIALFPVFTLIVVGIAVAVGAGIYAYNKRKEYGKAIAENNKNIKEIFNNNFEIKINKVNQETKTKNVQIEFNDYIKKVPLNVHKPILLGGLFLYQKPNLETIYKNYKENSKAPQSQYIKTITELEITTNGPQKTITTGTEPSAPPLEGVIRNTVPENSLATATVSYPNYEPSAPTLDEVIRNTVPENSLATATVSSPNYEPSAPTQEELEKCPQYLMVKKKITNNKDKSTFVVTRYYHIDDEDLKKNLQNKIKEAENTRQQSKYPIAKHTLLKETLKKIKGFHTKENRKNKTTMVSLI